MKTYVWDLPTRLFHWLLVAGVMAAFVTGKIGGNAMVWHGRIGLMIIGLLTFRIIWGFIGATYARFAQFVRGPRAIRAYLKGEWQGLGHNPLGALSVLALLAALSLQAATGLFSNDDIAFEGYLTPLVGSELSGKITGIHRLLEKVLLLLTSLHIGAIIFYARVKKRNLVKPMLTGWTESEDGESARGGGWPAFISAILVAGLTVTFAAGVWLSEPTATPEGAQAPSF